ncbi:MAG: dolichol kinase [Desulfurococcales archaeon]|nr:dolichol kinase [Desulfurococcales archaeon]
MDCLGATCVDPASMARDALAALPLGAMVLAVVYATKPLYHAMRRRGLPHNVAIYYNRKVIHAAAGGVVALLVPVVFREPLVPLAMALALGGFLLYMRRSGRLMYWFQTPENAYEVNFTIAWGASVALLWAALGDPRLAVLPALFIAFGDAVTGVVRNALFARRTKHWAGNVAMLAVTIPLGLAYGGALGGLAGLVAGVVERFEFPPVDDNILIALATTALLLLAA